VAVRRRLWWRLEDWRLTRRENAYLRAELPRRMFVYPLVITCGLAVLQHGLQT